MNRIKELRLERGWLQKDLEQAMNLGRGNVSKYEKEDRALSSPLIRQFCEIFGCTADYLLGMSTQQTLSISDEDAALLEAYHAAPPDTQAGIATILRPFMEEKTLSALPGEQGDERHG